MSKLIKNGRLVPIWSNINELPESERKNAKFYYKKEEEVVQTEKEPDSGCLFHEWVSYFGFTERYKFCSKCDKKESL